MGSSLSVTNKTECDLHISLKQVTPLYFENFVKPEETFTRNVGKVWFTIEARLGFQRNAYSTRDILLSCGLTFLTVCISFAAGAPRVICCNDGFTVIRSCCWYAKKNRRFEIRQMPFDEMDDMTKAQVSYFRKENNIQFYLVEV